MTLTVDVQVASDGDDNPDPDSIRWWLETALADRISTAEAVEVCVRIVNEEESRQLNNQYRHKNSSTNVLSFPSGELGDIPVHHLGDIVICNTVVKREAREQSKECRAHWAHMVVHGGLHLLGYDHMDDKEADEMEGLENKILTQLHFPPQYQAQLQQ